jgi:hypothetical protein
MEIANAESQTGKTAHKRRLSVAQDHFAVGPDSDINRQFRFEICQGVQVFWGLMDWITIVIPD